ncbi:MAG: hypothetical protein ACTSRZ_08285 [Promethearchaeota archaeon]
MDSIKKIINILDYEFNTLYEPKIDSIFEGLVNFAIFNTINNLYGSEDEVINLISGLVSATNEESHPFIINNIVDKLFITAANTPGSWGLFLKAFAASLTNSRLVEDKYNLRQKFDNSNSEDKFDLIKFFIYMSENRKEFEDIDFFRFYPLRLKFLFNIYDIMKKELGDDISFSKKIRVEMNNNIREVGLLDIWNEIEEGLDGCLGLLLYIQAIFARANEELNIKQDLSESTISLLSHLVEPLFNIFHSIGLYIMIDVIKKKYKLSEILKLYDKIIEKILSLEITINNNKVRIFIDILISLTKKQLGFSAFILYNCVKVLEIEEKTLSMEFFFKFVRNLILKSLFSALDFKIEELDITNKVRLENQNGKSYIKERGAQENKEKEEENKEQQYVLRFSNINIRNKMKKVIYLANPITGSPFTTSTYRLLFGISSLASQAKKNEINHYLYILQNEYNLYNIFETIKFWINSVDIRNFIETQIYPKLEESNVSNTTVATYGTKSYIKKIVEILFDYLKTLKCQEEKFEKIEEPIITLKRGGDCDCLTTAAATVLATLDIDSNVCILLHDIYSSIFRKHVFLEILIGEDEKIYFDPMVNTKRLGDIAVNNDDYIIKLRVFEIINNPKKLKLDTFINHYNRLRKKVFIKARIEDK